jgi:beta-1,3-galactosyltransferase
VRYFAFSENQFVTSVTRDPRTVSQIMYISSIPVISQSLEPWLASEVRVSGEIKLLSVIASGLPTSEEVDHVVDLELLKAPPLLVKKTVNLVIGVFSNANNFKRRMSIRRTWMQYDAVRSGSVVVRFFVGLVRKTMDIVLVWKNY